MVCVSVATCVVQPALHRIRLWLRVAPRLGGDVFVKLYAHGAQERHRSLLEGDLDRLFTDLRRECVERELDLRYATAWEMRQAVARAAA